MYKNLKIIIILYKNMADIVKKIPVLLKFINGKINDKIDYLHYQENNKLIEKQLIDFKNEILYVQNNNFNFKISINKNVKEFKVILKNDTINNILINLNPNCKKKISQVEILIEDSSSQNSDLMIEYNEEKVFFKMKYNDLQIGRVIILNSDLNFQLYIMAQSYLNNIEIEKRDNEIEKRDIEIEKRDIEIEKRDIEIEKRDIEIEKLLKIIKDNNIDIDISNYEKPIKIENPPEKKTFIGKKRDKKEKVKSSNKTENNRTEEIKFTIDESKIGDKMLICIHNYDKNKIATVHDMTETNIIDDPKLENSNYDPNEFNSYLNKNSNIINDFINKINENKIEEINKININFNEKEIDFWKYSNYDIDDKRYLLFLKDSFEYIYNSTLKINYNIIKNIIIPEIDKIKNNHELTDFIKKIMINIFSYFDYFREYMKYLNNEESTISNLIIPDNKNLSRKDKMNILSSIMSIMLVSPYFNKNKKIEFFKINNDKNNIYYKANELLFNIIDNLNPDSAFLNGIKKTTSRIKPDLNKQNYCYYTSKIEENQEIIDNDIFIIEYKELSELKKEIKSNVPDLIVRFVDTKTLSKAQYDMCSGNILINEAIYKKKDSNFLDNDDNQIFDEYNDIIKGNIDLKNKSNKIKYDLCTFKSFWRLNHESLGHKPISKINSGKDTPTKAIMSQTQNFEKTEDAGEIVEYYIINSRKDDFYTIKNCEYDCSRLLDPSLYIEKTFKRFWIIVEELKIQDDDEEFVITEKIRLFNKIKIYFNNQRDIKRENEKKIKKNNYCYFKNKLFKE